MSTYQWLIILVIHDFKDKGYKKIIESIIKEFEEEGVAPCNKVLLVHDELYYDQAGQIKFKTAFKQLVLKSQSSLFEFEEIDVDPGFDYHDGRTWTELLKWINKNYLSEKTVLITLSDGAGFGLRDDVPDRQNITVKQSSQTFIPRNFLNPRFIDKLETQNSFSEKFKLYKGNLVYDRDRDRYCKALDMLWVTELANALENGFPDREIDMLMMVNCWMQTFETGWILRKKVKYLVAAETLFKAYGYAFDKLLRVINTKPGIEAKGLAKTIIPNFVTKWNKPGLLWHLKMVSVSVNDLRYYSVLKFLLERITEQLLKCDDKKFLEIIYYRMRYVANASSTPLPDHCRPSDATNIQMVDINHLFTTIEKVFPANPYLKRCIWIFRKISKSAVRDIHIGDDFIEHDKKEEKQFKLTGISIYLPNNLDTAQHAGIANCAYFGTTQILFNVFPDIPLEPFTMNSCWDELVTRYIKLLAATNPNNQAGHSAINAQP